MLRLERDPLGEVDLTALRVDVQGRNGGGEVRHAFSMLDRYDPATGVHSMARTTGYTATATVRMLSEGWYNEPGIAPPETIGRFKPSFDTIISYLRERRVVCEETVTGGPPILS